MGLVRLSIVMHLGLFPILRTNQENSIKTVIQLSHPDAPRTQSQPMFTIIGGSCDVAFKEPSSISWLQAHHWL